MIFIIILFLVYNIKFNNLNIDFNNILKSQNQIKRLDVII